MTALHPPFFSSFSTCSSGALAFPTDCTLSIARLLPAARFIVNWSRALQLKVKRGLAKTIKRKYPLSTLSQNHHLQDAAVIFKPSTAFDGRSGGGGVVTLVATEFFWQMLHCKTSRHKPLRRKSQKIKIFFFKNKTLYRFLEWGKDRRFGFHFSLLGNRNF